MKRVALSFVLVCLAACLAAAGEPITIGETVTIQSALLGEERTILVSTPPRYDQGSERFPVLYMTDGDSHLTHTRGTVDFLVRNGLMPPLIVVGVTNTDRTRDLSPTNASITEDDGRVRELPTSGGANTFLDFFERELFPYVESHYRTQPYRVLAGHSFGGLFTLHALFARSELFDAFIAVSPSLDWDDELPLRQARSFFAGRAELDATLFLAMADELEDDPRPNQLDRLEETLKTSAAKGFEWQVMRMPDETHGSVVLRAHYWGLRKVFEPWRLPTDPETGRVIGNLAAIKEHYACLSKRHGFQIVPPEDPINQAGYQLLDGDVDGAIAVFRYNVELHPDSANPYDSLGEGLERGGHLKEALANYSRAVENAATVGDDRLPLFTRNRDRLKQRLEEVATD